YGSADVLKCEEVAKPTPKDNEVLIRVRAASINPLDWRMMKGTPSLLRIFFGFRKPRHGRPGRDVAGQLEAVGRNVTQFKAGDDVFGACDSTIAEYTCARESAVAIKPEKLTFEQAASIPVAGLSALQGLRDKGKVQPGQKVLINGAAGGVGTFAVQLAKYFGAHVTGVCSTRNVEFVKSIGADAVIDYTKQDFTEREERYDVILECVGNKSVAECRHVLNANGRHIMVGAAHDPTLIDLFAPLIKAFLLSPFSSRKSIPFIAKPREEDLELLGDLIASGKLTPVIDRSYNLSEVPAAMRYLEAGHARGKVVIVVSSQ
ncbi:MAG TPA: NAD(P)-dependent alcohol dehydrogenase, partial [Blastocatellia bacterium]|nr:NAD(P)-dependent alcohol dehydrogenase [Blastocatellia bacterium]